MKPKNELRMVAGDWHTKVAESLERYGIKYFQSSFNNQVLLLNWKVWSLRYGVSLHWIVDKILQYYSKAREARGAGNQLGIGIPAITGEKTQIWIQECVSREFPSGENLAVRRSELQARMVSPPIKIKTGSEVTVDGYIKEYRRLAHNIRNKTTSESSKFTRAWRGNPWL